MSRPQNVRATGDPFQPFQSNDGARMPKNQAKPKSLNSPKAEVRGSNPFGRAIKRNTGQTVAST